MTGVRSVSYSSGVQPKARLVLAAQHRIDYDTFVMATVGDDSEDPASLELSLRTRLEQSSLTPEAKRTEQVLDDDQMRGA